MKAYPHSKHFSDSHSNDFMNGMDLRDFFAAHAMQGFLAEGTAFGLRPGESEEEALARVCYLQADAMMEARNAK